MIREPIQQRITTIYRNSNYMSWKKQMDKRVIGAVELRVKPAFGNSDARKASIVGAVPNVLSELLPSKLSGATALSIGITIRSMRDYSKHYGKWFTRGNILINSLEGYSAGSPDSDCSGSHIQVFEQSFSGNGERRIFL
jgi:hypothetical protein